MIHCFSFTISETHFFLQGLAVYLEFILEVILGKDFQLEEMI